MSGAKKVYLPRQIAVRLKPDVGAWLDAKADEEQMPVSEYVRKLLEKEAQRRVMPCGCGAPERDPHAA